MEKLKEKEEDKVNNDDGYSHCLKFGRLYLEGEEVVTLCGKRTTIKEVNYYINGSPPDACPECLFKFNNL